MGIPALTFDSQLTRADRLVLQQLSEDMSSSTDSSAEPIIAKLKAINDPSDGRFEPTVFTTYDHPSDTLALPGVLRRLLTSYTAWARSACRVETDVVFITHLLLYFSTTLPSAILLFTRFSPLHALFHVLMQGYYMGPYTLLKHQHIHQRGVLAKRFALIDNIFPYIMDPLMGHTWNSYYYHHVKHHHVEGNGPGDLSSTIRFQRDSLTHFLQYLGRFFFLVWFDLPRYFIRSGRPALGIKCGVWELASYAALALAMRVNARAAVFVFLLPLVLLRVALMVGNWGQHAFVDEEEPDSDFRSSVTLVDVSSNRYCFNDGYHTSHHLNPLRHWRDHPIAFLQARHDYAAQDALVFHNIDYVFITIRLLMKDYDTLAKCLVPIGAKQIAMTHEERMAMLKSHTRQFSEEEIAEKFNLKAAKKEAASTGASSGTKQS
ncbi:hypothetical protein B0T14DRAFT_513882 [Immersiella caudata]|uniref:Fatty acid desaturase domain-containing protein n=1 Tax=Immersiella caudata TaxID=314043 RepID=A0AA39WVN5_9PEZI|nr:hypothetical protein B0T14DRAFT_513882 [Immersiella caudata]